MYHGFVKVAAVTPTVTPADCEFNANNIISEIHSACKNGAEIVVLPLLCVSGATCKDLFLYDALLDACDSAVQKITRETSDESAILFVGAPVKRGGSVYNCTIAISGGKVLGYVPQCSDGRYFSADTDAENKIDCNMIFTCKSNKALKIMVNSARLDKALALSAGVTVIVDARAEKEVIGLSEKRKRRVASLSEELSCATITASAGYGESTTDAVYAGHDIICENGKILAESELFENSTVYAEIDVEFLHYKQRKDGLRIENHACYAEELFDLPQKERAIDRKFDRFPFVPDCRRQLDANASFALMAQITALKTRIDRTKTKSLVVGVSGGLDSTLALVVAVEASRASQVKPRVIAITMPCFGTTQRTRNNSVALARALNAELREINIKNSVNSHFADIGHSGKVYDVTYENAQARERTQVLMDVANMEGGMVIGTGDMSELALGWATYNGDHMSMYGVNASVPKTFIPHILSYYVSTVSDEQLKNIVLDVLDTPVSPELLPTDGKEMTQKTEDFVGPYELHDFFLYNLIKRGWTPKKVYFIAKQTFSNYSSQEILKWLRVFIRRFFTQQFKRSCTPDGAPIGSVSLSSRGDFYIPSDASASAWLGQLEDVE